MRFGSLFSGIGGMDLGLEQAGITCAWQVENDPYCRAVLKRHWPNVLLYDDIRTFTGEKIPHVDLIAGGFPCQDVSVAGRGAGLGGERSGLWFEMLRVVRETRPRYVLVENVPALLIRGMDRVLGGLAECGYDAEWTMLSARQFGANHLRRRVFIVAYPNGQRGTRLEPCGSPRIFGSWQRSSETDLRLADWRTRPLFDRGPAPLLCRGKDGISNRVQRLKGIGNAVMPPMAKWIGQQIIAAEKERVTNAQPNRANR